MTNPWDRTPEESRRDQLSIDAHNLEFVGKWEEAIPVWEALIVDEFVRAVPFKRLIVSYRKLSRLDAEEQTIKLAIDRFPSEDQAAWFKDRLASVRAKVTGIPRPKRPKKPSRGNAPRPAPSMEVAIAEDACRDALLARNFREAVMIPLRLRVQRGSLYISDLNAFDPTRAAGELQHIFAINPAILRGINPEIVPAVRLAAAMCHAFSLTEPVRRWLDDSLDTHIHLEPRYCARMYLFAVVRRPVWEQMLADLYGMFNVGYRVWANPEHACAVCLADNNVWYSRFDVPEIPHANCTCGGGCCCATDCAVKE